MQKSRFTETQIIAILKEAESGMLVKDVCRKHGISDATYYNWKSNIYNLGSQTRMLSSSGLIALTVKRCFLFISSET